MNRRFLFIVNPTAAAGRTRRRWEALDIPVGGGKQSRVVFTSGPGHARQLAQLGARDADVVVAVGGDGTANEVAAGLLDSPTPDRLLAVLPLGTGNDLARGLGITDTPSALRLLEGGSPCRIDVIEVTLGGSAWPRPRVALVYAVAGCAAELLRRTTPAVKRIFGPQLAYPVGLLRALRHLRAARMRVRWNGAESEEPLLLAGVGNAAAAGGGALRLFPKASMTDGRMDALLVGRLGLFTLLRQLPRLSTGAFLDHPAVRHARTDHLELTSDHPLPVQIDGELAGETPASFRIRPAALRVLTPFRCAGLEI
jgi:diacylglycerol kinase (ATP)